MLTRCPACATSFRVSPRQLEIAAGRVRCGRCGNLFQIPQAEAEAETGEPVSPPEAAPLPAVPPPAATPADAALPKARRSRGMLWGLGCLLGALALGGQWLWWNRNTLKDPLAQELVQLLCRQIPCALSPARAPERIEVLARNLEADPQRAGVLQFRLSLANRAPEPQPYPRIELRLFDHLDRLVAARRFFPMEYLPPGTDLRGLLAPDQPLELALDLRDPGNQVTGFQIDFL